MSLTRKSFQDTASRMINETFKDFRDDIVLTGASAFDYDTQTETNSFTYTGKGIRNTFNKSAFNGESVQIGDYQVIMEQQPIGQDITIGSVNMAINGKDVKIIDISEDAARAVYTFQVRDL
jgi:hypothetical protein